MYNDTGFTLTRRQFSNLNQAHETQARKTPESAARRVLPALNLRSREDGLRSFETAFFALILGGFALSAGTFAVQLLT